MGRWKKNKRKITAGCLAGILIFQYLSGTFDVVAYEIGKVSSAPSKGLYYDEEVLVDEPKNESEEIEDVEKVAKDPVVSVDDAQQQGEEVIEERTANSKTYKLEDGTYVKDTYFDVVHKKEGDEFVDIDNTLENKSFFRSAPIYENKDGQYQFKVQDDTMTMTNENEQSIALTMLGMDLNTYSVKENVILYTEVQDNIDLEYRLNGNHVSTNIFLNGPIDHSEISFDIHKGNLQVKEESDALLFTDEADNVVFVLAKPMMKDMEDEVSLPDFKYVENGEDVEVTITLDATWTNNSLRTYPITLNTRASDATAEINVETAYNRSLDPYITSQYYDLYVGYEDGSLSGGYHFGISRTYVHVSGMDLGPDKIVLGAKLKLFKTISEYQQWNTIAIGKTSGYISPKDATWNNMPYTSNISTTNVRSDTGWQEFDVTSYIKDIYNGVNNTIELRATNESSSYTPNIFSSESGTGMPKITVTYRDAFDVDPNLPITTFDTEMRVFSKADTGFAAISFDGIAKPDSQVRFDMVQRGQNDVLMTETSKGNSNRYFVNPIYISNPIANTQKYTKGDVNYTTNYIYADKIPEFDTPYEYKMKVKYGSSTSTNDFRSDSFIKYKVKTGDNLKNVASYYGITIDQIKADNNLKTNIIKEDDVLFIRFKKNNDKVSKDVYTPPTRTIEYKAIYVNRGPTCASGMCPVIDPVNATTGNYYYEGNDFTIKDGEDFPFMRYYNSTGPQVSNIFGNGFTTTVESYLSYDKNGNILYFAGDGRIFQFEKNGNTYTSRPQDKMDISVNNNIVTIQDLNKEITYRFDAYGYLDTITSKAGMITHINYDAYGLITKVDVGKKSFTFTYNEKKLVSAITLPSGNQVHYTYDSNRNLIEFKDALGNVKTYTYDDKNYLVSIKDKNDQVATSNTYDDQGRVLSQTDGNGNTSTIDYRSDSTYITKGDGKTEQYYFNQDYDIVSILENGEVTSSYTYDTYRNITTSTNEDGEITTYTYDGIHPTKVEYEDGTYEEYQYDGDGNAVFIHEKDGKETSYTFSGKDIVSKADNEQQQSAYVYDSEHRVIKETDALGVSKEYTYEGNMIKTITNSNGLVETFEYDANGNTIKESDNQGKIFTYLYDVNNQMTQKNYPDATNERWTYDANGNIETYKDRIGGVTRNTYDNNNNLINTQKGTMVIVNTYDEINQLIKKVDEQGRSTSYTYDAKGNKASETDMYGNTTTYEYDANGNVIKTTDPFGNEEINVYEHGNLMKSIAKDGAQTIYEYDEHNRQIKKINPNGSEETSVYQGQNLVSQTDGKGTITLHEYDAYGREIKTTTTYTDGFVSVHESEYDVYGNVIKDITDGIATENTYDVYNQLISTMDAVGNTTYKEYDFDGNVIKEIDALGYAVTTVYDGNANVISTTDKNGNTETKTYNPNSQLISDTDALGFVKTYEYNNFGQLEKVIDPYTHTATYTYDAYGNCISVALEGKEIEKKAFDSYGREIYNETLESITSSSYDEFNRIIESKNELTGLTTYTTYDSFGNVIEEKDSEGLVTTYEYDEFQRKVKTIDPHKRTEINTYDIRDHIIETKAFDGLVTKTIYDEKGNVEKTIDPYGKVTTNTYNDVNQLIHIEEGNKATTYVLDANGKQIQTIDDATGTSIQTIYDPNGNIIEAIDALGYSTKTTYDEKNQVIAMTDANGNTTKKTYDAYGNVVKEEDALGNIKQTVFNEFGLVTMEVDERGFQATYTYNDQLLLETITDSNGNSLAKEYNNLRQVIKETNPNGGITTYEYDAYGREYKKIEPNGKEIIKVYDALGNVVKETNGNKIIVSTYDSLGRLTRTTQNTISQTVNEYNDLNQIIKSYDANQNVSTFAYDEYNRVISSNEKGYITTMEYDIYGNVVKQTDNKTYVTINTYDANQRLLETKVNDTTTILKEYDGNGNEIRLVEKGLDKRTTYNANNKVIKIELPSASTDTFVAVQTIEYDESGNPIKITDANGNCEEKKYDANNNVIEEINPNQSKTLYEYDALNNVTKVQNDEERYVSYSYDKANNVIYKTINDKVAQSKYDKQNHLLYEENENGYGTTYEYDVFDRKTKEIKPDGTEILYAYDDNGNLLKENDHTYSYDQRNNQLTATNKDGTVTITYDAFNQKTSVTDTNNNMVSYVYDSNKNLIQEEYGDTKVNYTYDSHNNITTVEKDHEIIASYTYNNRNEVIETKQKDTITTKTYDDMGRTLTQTSIKDEETIFDAAYTYDANNNIIKEIIDGKENTYTYNAYDELSESHKYVNDTYIDTTYEYDIYGNQIENSSSTGKKIYSYNDKNQVKKIESDTGITTFTYDDNGNIEKKVNEDGRVDLYTYDDFNQLIELDQGQYVYGYTYDGQKERVRQTITDTKDYHYDVWYTYSEEIEIKDDTETAELFQHLREQAERKSDNACELDGVYDVAYYKEPKISEYTLDRNQEYTQVLQENDTTHVYGNTLLQTNEETIVTGQNNSVIAKVDKNDIQKISYSDYGVTKDMKTGHGYNAEMKDVTGLIYLRARYYDPSISRFIQIDQNYGGEKEHVGSQNRYVYTLNNPYKYVDRDGNKSSYECISNILDVGFNVVKSVFNKKVNAINKMVSIAKDIVSSAVNPETKTGALESSSSGGFSILTWLQKMVNAITNCPKLELKVTPLDILLNYINWTAAIEDVRLMLTTNLNFNGMNILFKHLKEGVSIKGTKITVSGARKAIKDIAGLATGPKMSLINALEKSLGFQIRDSFKGFDLFLFLMDVGKDFLVSAYECYFGFITFIKAVANTLASILYNVIRTVASALLRTILMPVFGPFAWFITLLIDVGIDVIDWFVDMKSEISKLIDWILNQNMAMIINFTNALKNLI